MDIDLLSKMVKELILDSDEVALPGIGTFVAELIPSTFSDKGYTINPPYRRLIFRQRQNDADTALVDFYAASNNVESATAKRIIEDFLEGLRQTLKEKKVVVFPGLGRLRATRQNNFFFIASEDLDIYPAGFGLEPVSLKTHEETEDEISAAVVGLGAFIDFPEEFPDIEPVMEPVSEKKLEEELKEETKEEEKVKPTEEEKAEEIKEEEEAPEETKVEEGVTRVDVEEEPKKKSRAWKGVLWTMLILVIAAAVFFAAFMLLAKYAPYALDRLLYTREELSIINYKF